jgi:hypothetical protein
MIKLYAIYKELTSNSSTQIKENDGKISEPGTLPEVPAP